MLGRGYADHGFDALAQAQALQPHCTVFSGHHIHIAARGSYRTRQTGNDFCIARFAQSAQRNDGRAAFALRCGTHKIHLPADCAYVIAAYGFGIDLPC